MIDINVLYTRVNADLSRLNKSGYTATAEFNRDVQQAQIILLNFYHRQYEQESHIAEAVLPFKKEAALTATSGIASLPNDFRHLLSVYTYYIKAACGAAKAVRRRVPMKVLKAHQQANVLSGGIYEPDLSMGIAWCELFPGQLNLYPQVRNAMIVYLRNPVVAVRGIDVDVVNDLEVYNATTTTDLEWPDQEFSNFVNLLMYFKGVSVKESALVQFAAGQGGVLQSMI